MDFDLIFPILIFVFWLLSQVLGSKKRPQQGTRPPSGPMPEQDYPGEERLEPAYHEPENDLEHALREIREALGGGAPQPKPQPKPTLQPGPRPQSIALPPSRKLETIRPPSSDVFEKQNISRVKKPIRGAASKAPTTTGKQASTGPKAEQVSPIALRKRLQNASALREATIFQQILSPPRSRRGPGRR